MDKVDKDLLGADLEQAREQLQESTARIVASQRHPHEPELPAAFDAAGRCVVCGLLLEIERLRYGLEEIASFPISGYHAGAAQRIAHELLNNRAVTKSPDPPITEERPRDVGAPRGRDMTEVTAMQGKRTESGDTDNRWGRIVGVEDDDGQAWCFECAHAEIRQAGEAAFMGDLYAGESARRKCVNCKRPIGEVQG